MERDSGRIRPETHALDAFIQATVERLLSNDTRSVASNDGLLFLGNWHDAMPRLIFQDPVLQPVDTRIWGVIKIAAAGSGPTAFPTYKQIARTANVGSEATVARSMAILRAARWLSLCQRVRDTQGRFRGNIYALHDEPLPLADMLYLDQDYVQFLEQAQSHAHPQVRKVATAVLGTIEEDLQQGDGGIENSHPLHRRQEAARALQGEASRFFGFSSRQLQNLKSAPEPASLQKLKCGPLQNLKSDGSSSCSYINKKTTTTTTAEMKKTDARAREAESVQDNLALPASLTANEQRLARLCLGNAPQAMHQDILDELAGRLLAAKRKSEPIENPIGYLAQLCKVARKGAFTLTSLGLNTREQRHQAAHLKQLEERSRERALADMKNLLAHREPSYPEQIHKGGDGSAISPLPKSPSPSRRTPRPLGDGSAITPPHDILPDGSAITSHHDSTDDSAINPATGPPDGPHERCKP
ncbi:MAG TPA: STY4528 family pathogenicity island replication protein [Gammaproteobacteria bacterium]